MSSAPKISRPKAVSCLGKWGALMLDPDDLAKMGRLASGILRLRTAASAALVAFAEIEESESRDEARARARTARVALRRALGMQSDV